MSEEKIHRYLIASENSTKTAIADCKSRKHHILPRERMPTTMAVRLGDGERISMQFVSGDAAIGHRRSPLPEAGDGAIVAEQSMKTGQIIAAAAAIAAIASGAILLAGPHAPPAAAVVPPPSPAGAERTRPLAAAAPTERAAEPGSAAGAQDPASPIGAAPLPGERDVVGLTPPVRGDLNANVRSVVEAARTGTHPERLSYLVPATPWDPAAFAKDPQAYIDVVEPGRCFQTAPEGADMPSLQIVGDAAVTVAQGEPAILRVQTRAHAPATFTSTGCGRFQNSLTSVSVLADDHGVASATFVAPPGTLNGVSIIVGSPMTAGHLLYAITVTPALASASTR